MKEINSLSLQNEQHIPYDFQRVKQPEDIQPGQFQKHVTIFLKELNND